MKYGSKKQIAEAVINIVFGFVACIQICDSIQPREKKEYLKKNLFSIFYSNFRPQKFPNF
jgi:hypothetical protein